jgi:hypothetical protein
MLEARRQKAAGTSAIRSSPQPGWSLLMRWMKPMCSAGMRGRPGLRARQRQ